MNPAPEQEFGLIEAVELMRPARRGSMRPLLCRGSDGAHYVLKPFVSGGPWPLVLEWTCARLGRAIGLPIPNYRQIRLSPELADEWNALNDRHVDAGVGFGSQLLSSAIEFETALMSNIPEDLKLRLFAFDWWVRNRDRTEKNPNLLWSAETRALYVIDHDQAGQDEGADLFWSTHVFRSLALPGMVWPPPAVSEALGSALTLADTIMGEMPSTWTTNSEGLSWFVRQLNRSLTAQPHRDWRNHD